eukprot:CAMPEP_0170453840 /NCGR_PEP_ID=MMETSP0123-20130129/2297_1 /TAXON_ID=182087 /ORGANISM="Favella ehrenbergii, Strain Fehren 1" /LENGTH=61 /DNA_ID=CAMNT_0010716365 /DNA_START=242 /DNA_END=427 /DNA_ORIENTATION=+
MIGSNEKVPYHGRHASMAGNLLGGDIGRKLIFDQKRRLEKPAEERRVVGGSRNIKAMYGSS